MAQAMQPLEEQIPIKTTVCFVKLIVVPKDEISIQGLCAGGLSKLCAPSSALSICPHGILEGLPQMGK